ncbi:Ig-like domain-containing protein [Chitinibacter sp. FCG-7]|uniref:Ig-like domain-containing protein n=1 Tax=Chitinibacter mangrovi TaxID=3153927 RepID=A0AAU7F643_9NEIS
MHKFVSHLPYRQTMIRAVIIGALGATLTACGGGGGTSLTLPGEEPKPQVTPAPIPAEGRVTLSPSQATLALGEQIQVTAMVVDANNKPVSGAIVKFTTNEKLGLLSPNSGLTGADGKVVTTLSVASISASGNVGELAVEASYKDANGASKSVKNSIPYQIGASTLKIDSIGVGATSISANANTSIDVVASVNGKPIAGEVVNFSSQCAQSGKAKIDATAVTNSNGKATASFTDKGCGQKDTVTATLSNGKFATTTFDIAPPAATSLQFSTITPADGVITLKGFGSATRPETAQVSFKLVDATGAAISGQPVTFSLDITVGGVALQNAVGGVVTATTDANGIATATVLAGNQPTPVRVTAKAGSLVSTSGKLAISSGFPDQDSISFAADKYNINGWGHDGAKASITMRFADHFNNPIPDGTAINFITDGGRIGSGTQGSCSTKDSQCTIELSSQEPRPRQGTVNAHNGRVHVLAYAVGEESYVDKNSNIVADQDSELVDINGVSSDIGEAFIDVNENGVFNQGIDQLVDFNGNNAYDAPDGKFNGTLCAPGFAKCSNQKTLNVFRQATFIFSSDNPKRPEIDKTLSGACNTTDSLTAYIPDINTNILPAGTTIAIATTDGDGKVTFGSSHIVPSAAPNTGAIIYKQTLFDFNFKYGSIADDGKPSCKSGTMTITVTPPDHGGGALPPSVYGYKYTVIAPTTP